MVNKNVFSKQLPKADTTNYAGGTAYKMSPKHALAQMACTGMIGNTFYQSAQTELDRIVSLANEVDDMFLAKLAVYSRNSAYMKDMPAVLTAILSTRNPELTHVVFPQCIDNGKMLRTFFTIVRSGVLGRRGFGSALKRDMQDWFNNASYNKLVNAKIGNDPELRDIMRMVRPRPINDERRALFGYLTDSPVEKWRTSPDNLPNVVKALDRFRKTSDVREQAALASELKVRWDLYSGSIIDNREVWTEVAKNMRHQALRMNLNTLARHGVFDDPKMIDYVAERIASPEEVSQARQFPYQYFAAYLNVDHTVPYKLKSALHDAAELACGNVPKLDKPVIIAIDTSGSMGQTVGGRNNSKPTVMTCVQAASLFGAAMLRTNPDSVILPFDTRVHNANIDPGDSILSIAERIAKYGGGGTDCSCAISFANKHLRSRKFGGIVMVSDNESWYGHNRYSYGFGLSRSTPVVTEWETFKGHNKGAKMICIDLAPYGTLQAPDDSSVLNVGGFSDSVFNTVAGFMADDNSRFVNEVENVVL